MCLGVVRPESDQLHPAALRGSVAQKPNRDHVATAGEAGVCQGHLNLSGCGAEERCLR